MRGLTVRFPLPRREGTACAAGRGGFLAFGTTRSLTDVDTVAMGTTVSRDMVDTPLDPSLRLGPLPPVRGEERVGEVRSEMRLAGLAAGLLFVRPLGPPPLQGGVGRVSSVGA